MKPYNIDLTIGAYRCVKMKPGCILMPVEYNSIVYVYICVHVCQLYAEKYSTNVTTQHTSDDSLVSSTGSECIVVWCGYEIETRSWFCVLTTCVA